MRGVGVLLISLTLSRRPVECNKENALFISMDVCEFVFPGPRKNRLKRHKKGPAKANHPRRSARQVKIRFLLASSQIMKSIEVARLLLLEGEKGK
jgi:hypothetical protein